jgi:hypothetical protein
LKAREGRALGFPIRNFRFPLKKIKQTSESAFALGGLAAICLCSISIELAFPDMEAGWAIWIIIGFSFIVYGIWAGIFDFIASDNEGDGSARDDVGEEDKQQGPLTVDTAALIYAISKQSKANREQEAKEESTKKTREALTIGIIFVTAVAIYAQVREMIKVYGPIRDQAKAIRESFIAIQRAYLSIDEPTITPVPDPSGNGKTETWAIKTVVRNRGPTPADAMIKSFVGGINRDSCPVLYQAYAPMDPDSAVAYVRRARVPANGYYPVGAGDKANEDHIGFGPYNGSAMWNMQGIERDYFFGSVHYRDVFSDTPEHVTKFCFVLHARRSSATSDIEFYNAGFCAFWNCSDEECEADKADFDKQIKERFNGLPKDQQHCDLGVPMP